MNIETVYKANEMYFDKDNKKFFGDIAYYTIKSASGQYYFLNHTNMWSDMFDGKKEACYRLSTLDQATGKILDLIDGIFPDMKAVNNYLQREGV